MVARRIAGYSPDIPPSPEDGVKSAKMSEHETLTDALNKLEHAQSMIIDAVTRMEHL